MSERSKSGGRRPLNPRQQRFVEQYLIDLNATRAAGRAGYSRKTAKEQGSRLLTNVHVARAIGEALARVTERAELTAERVLEEIRRLAFCDARGFFLANGDLKPFSLLTAEQGSQLAGFDVIIANAKAGDGQTDTIHKIKIWDKTRALEMAARYFGLIRDKVDITINVGEEIAKALEEGRRRAALRVVNGQ